MSKKHYIAYHLLILKLEGVFVNQLKVNKLQ